MLFGRSWGAGRAPRTPVYDPGRERRAEVKARKLLRTVAGERAYAMYRELGFLVVRPRPEDSDAGYGYLIYPHRSIVAFDDRDGSLLSEYCVGFPDHSGSEHGTRLPDADDVLAKWIALSGDERRLLADANMHLPGRQVDPAQARRDLRRLRAWDARERREQTMGVAA